MNDINYEGELRLSEEFVDNIYHRVTWQYLAAETSLQQSLEAMHEHLNKKLMESSGSFFFSIATAKSGYSTSIEPQRLSWLLDVATKLSKVIMAYEAACSKNNQGQTYQIQPETITRSLAELLQIFERQLDPDHCQKLCFDLPAFGTRSLLRAISDAMSVVDLMRRDRQACREKAWDPGRFLLYSISPRDYATLLTIFTFWSFTT